MRRLHRAEDDVPVAGFRQSAAGTESQRVRTGGKGAIRDRGCTVHGERTLEGRTAGIVQREVIQGRDTAGEIDPEAALPPITTDEFPPALKLDDVPPIGF